MMDTQFFEGENRAGPVRVTLHGTRGTLPSSGPAFVRYGGNTICTEISFGSTVLLFDAGSGLLSAGIAAKQDPQPDAQRTTDLFFSHFHYDHTMGFPIFPKLYQQGNIMRIWSGLGATAGTTHEVLRKFMAEPFFPITIDGCRAHIEYCDFTPGDLLEPRPGIAIETGSLCHPGGAVGYRVCVAGRVIAIITDTEHQNGVPDAEVLHLIRDADLMLYDATFTDDELPHYAGWGHSTWQEALRLAQSAGVKRVGLIHHSPKRTDAELDAIAREAQSRFSGAFVGQDGQIIEL